ncbi:unnamed protein product [Acanthoscelides obtectus]|uniref:Reverse transcriptase domain-containing protein n=1 Tax=Acanthoscelides obtectus TaxID=200917 RepID=A0A9P0PQI4_ACAOB|nr:unnamed protein product [Acanthoscelides obtectus]CAK1672317.1 Probable RNA-directed DNA polymerase from transposon X-element [Acanthoscelides obtectus]
MMKLRDKALRKYHRTKNHNDWLGYNTLKNKINHAINKEKQVYFEQQVALNKNRMWKELGKLNIVNKKQNSLPQHLGTANQINNFFMQSISGDNNEPDQYTLRFFSDTQLPHEAFEFSYTNDNEVYQKLLSVKSTAVGADGISISMLLYSCPTILPYLTHIFNYCLKFNVIPKIWKLAQVIPIPKKSNPEDVGDLRPISILCTPSKVFEVILDARMRDFVAKNDILPENQSGFRSGHSCTTALLKAWLKGPFRLAAGEREIEGNERVDQAAKELNLQGHYMNPIKTISFRKCPSNTYANILQRKKPQIERSSERSNKFYDVLSVGLSLELMCLRTRTKSQQSGILIPPLNPSSCNVSVTSCCIPR